MAVLNEANEEHLPVWRRLLTGLLILIGGLLLVGGGLCTLSNTVFLLIGMGVPEFFALSLESLAVGWFFLWAARDLNDDLRFAPFDSKVRAGLFVALGVLTILGGLGAIAVVFVFPPSFAMTIACGVPGLATVFFGAFVLARFFSRR